MELNKDNYFSQEANQAFWSASLVKEFLDCPSRALAELNGTWIRPKPEALLVGSYVDAFFEGTVETFRSENPDIFNSRTGELKAAYKNAETMIARASSDPVFMEYMTGDKQVIMTGDIAGYPFKCKMDVYVPGKRIVDLKTVKDLAPVWKEGQGRLNFASAWNWPLQMAIYQEIEGNHLPCYLAVITKEDPPTIDLVEIPQSVLDAELSFLKEILPRFDAYRIGAIEPERCEKCAHCRATKVLTAPHSLMDFEGGKE